MQENFRASESEDTLYMILGKMKTQHNNNSRHRLKATTN
ncbi:hypothetical protein GYH30_006398 [Glycine max]|nr:hypothetical protein GYH30_006398 [Glycine max]